MKKVFFSNESYLIQRFFLLMKSFFYVAKSLRSAGIEREEHREYMS